MGRFRRLRFAARIGLSIFARKKHGVVEELNDWVEDAAVIAASELATPSPEVQRLENSIEKLIAVAKAPPTR